MLRISRAWISMSVDWPSNPAEGWWIRSRLLGSENRLPLAPAGQQQRPHRHRDPDADRLDLGLDELHRVVDREAGVDRAAGAVDVDRDVLVGVLGLEVQQLGDDQVGDRVVDRRAEEDDPLVEQAAVDVELALPARGPLDHHRNQWHVPNPSGSLCRVSAGRLRAPGPRCPRSGPRAGRRAPASARSSG